MPRLTHNTSFWWFVLVCALFFAGVGLSFAVMLWQHLPAPDRLVVVRLIGQNASYLFGLAVILLAGLGFAVDWVFRLYILPIDRIAEKTGIIFGANPGLRIDPEGSRDLVRLAGAVNRAADRFEDLKRSVDGRIQEAGARSEEEKKILSVVIAELPEGVLICNPEGRITLYNERAYQLLAGPRAERTGVAGGIVGLGRSVFGIIDRSFIAHAIEDLSDKLRHGRHDLNSTFILTGRNDRFLRAEAVPILSPHREMSGFVLILTDITAQLETGRRVDTLFHSFITDLRGALASVRSAAEVILGYPDLSPEKLGEFNRIVHREVLAAAADVERAASEFARTGHGRGPLAPMRAKDFIEIVRRRAEGKLGIRIEGEPADDRLWLRVDGYSTALALLFVLERLSAESGQRVLRCTQQIKSDHVELVFTWSGAPLRMETLSRWENELVAVAGDCLTLSLREVLDRHKAELWSRPGDTGAESCLRLLLPAARPAEPALARRRTILPTVRPVYYDFDLFSQGGQSSEMDDCPLTGLVCTVFDTETTGLDPRGGDEIVAIGAVRIVNGRLLEAECFEQLVNPRRDLPWESVRIHGIQPEVLADQPEIAQALQSFHHFAEGTILVAHNAAFDMRLLQLKEEVSGVCFENPILDTMLLSAVLHPSQSSHDIEAIAERLGVTVMGRHTALGDAMATGEIFLKLIQALAEIGIRTLGQARRASQETWCAQLKY